MSTMVDVAMESQVKKGLKRNKLDQYKGAKFARNMVNFRRGKDKIDLSLSKKILNIIAERDTALLERNKALEEREAAIAQRNLAMKERDEAVLERDNALLALQHAMNQPTPYGTQCGTKKNLHDFANEPQDDLSDMNEREIHVVDTSWITLPALEAMRSHLVKQLKGEKSAGPISSKQPQSGKQVGKDLNHEAISGGQKSKNEWIDNDPGLNQVTFDESSMPAPGCSCTGIFRNCYKWGNGGWQSSCCTTTMSQYPLPRTPYRRYGRMGGRKMSGGVFTRLLNRLASEGHDLLLPVDLKDHWSKHGTNRYITIK